MIFGPISACLRALFLTRKVEYGMILGADEFDVLSQQRLRGQGDTLGRWEKKWQEGDQSYVQ